MAVQIGTATALSGYTIQSGESSVKKYGNVVSVNLMIKRDSPFSTTDTPVAVLPTGFRPSTIINNMCRGSYSQWDISGILYMFIDPAGLIVLKQIAGNNYTFASINCTFVID